jgi:hypothetical protein
MLLAISLKHKHGAGGRIEEGHGGAQHVLPSSNDNYIV